MYKILVFVILMASISCGKQKIPTEFTFIKLGQPLSMKSHDKNVGAPVYVKLLGNGDSLIVNLAFAPDIYLDTISRDSIVKTYKIPNTKELQSAMDHFILLTKDLDSFHLPNNEFDVNEQVIYSGGRYVVSYVHENEVKYVTFIYNRLPNSAIFLIEKFMALADENKPSDKFKTSLFINTDSIALDLITKMNIKNFDPPPIRDAIKFMPPTSNSRK